MNPSLLSGLRVVEFSAFVAAPSAGLALAQLGADVIRVDPPGGNIDVKRLPVNADGAQPVLGSAEPRQALGGTRPAQRRRAARCCSDLITAPGDGGRLFVTNLAVDGELAYDALRARRARPDHGAAQRLARRLERGGLHRQLRGRLSRRSPAAAATARSTMCCRPGTLIAGQMLALAVLAAERHRRLTGQGQHVSWRCPTWPWPRRQPGLPRRRRAQRHAAPRRRQLPVRRLRRRVSHRRRPARDGGGHHRPAVAGAAARHRLAGRRCRAAAAALGHDARRRGRPLCAHAS